MGCDIHLMVERKVGEQWIPIRAKTNYLQYYPSLSHSEYYGYFNWYDGRNYTLFGQLARVRDDYVDVVAEPRGLPKDASFQVKLASEQWGPDGHSHSWFTVQELLQFKRWEEDSQYFINTVKTKLKKLGPAHKVRIVFWFDN
jgi:hypothetical protein